MPIGADGENLEGPGLRGKGYSCGLSSKCGWWALDPQLRSFLVYYDYQPVSMSITGSALLLTYCS